MKIIKSITKNGKKIVTLECEPGEQPRCFRSGQPYKLGYPIEDVISGDEMLDAQPVEWSSVEQRWVI